MAILSKRVDFSHDLKLQICQSAVLFCILLLAVPLQIVSSRHVISSSDVLSITESQCVVAISNNQQKQTTEDGVAEKLFSYADVAFQKEPTVFVGWSDLQNFVWPSGEKLKTTTKVDQLAAVVFPRIVKDRTCLQKPNYFTTYPKTFEYSGSPSPEIFTEFINNHCNTFRKTDGSILTSGLHREYILNNLFSVQELPKSVTIAEIFKSHLGSKEVCMKNDGGEIHCTEQAKVDSRKLFENAPKCERIPLPNKEEFFHEYLARSKPVVITGAMDHWPALSKWTKEFFREEFGENEVHIKLTPQGEYEGVEPAKLWETYNTFQIPQDVLKQLPYPDLVVVRPATLNMKFANFLDLVENISSGILTNVSAYLEYTSISGHFPELQEDIAEMPFFRDVLDLAHTNIWLSDGNTLGKTHFDPFDNFLCQISGAKEVILFEPHNDYLYEAHIPEALLTYNATQKRFRRSTLTDSTSMVMSPLDILRPNFERFPKFGSARPLSCTIQEGDVLFMPAFWWHEVQSRPSATEHRNLAVNFWYEPFFEKEFPCPECQLDVCAKYRHLL